MSINKYGSVLRTYIIRNMYEDALASGVDIVIPAGAPPLRTAPQFTIDMNPQTNISIDKIGVFSNFADGLVFKNPYDRIDVTVDTVAFQNMSNSYTLQFTYGSKAVTTTIGAPGWTIGIETAIAITDPETGRITVMNIMPTAVDAGDLEDYWMYTTAQVQCNALQPVSIDNPIEQFHTISTLNCMYNFSKFEEPFLFSGGNPYDYVALRASLNYWSPHTTTFLTNSIDPAFDGNTVTFDLVLDIEFTKK